MAFQVTCPNCGSKARIYASRNQAAGLKGIFLKDLYVQCLGDCKARFVLQAGFSHYLDGPGTPPPVPKPTRNTPPDNQQKMF